VGIRKKEKMAQLLEIIDKDSTNALRVWCFSEALRTRDREALRLWLAEWEKSDNKKREGAKC
jgi:hypothetical protein